jgi:Nicastrin
VAAASLSNPGVPPGSLFSFLRAKPSISAAALTDFDTAFRNRFYGSRFDNGSNADVSSVATAAAVAARALHALAAGPDAAPLQVMQFQA